jgi:hypothetical protein
MENGMSVKQQYLINSVSKPLKGMNRVDERWNMHPQFYYDLLNGYVTRSASGQTLIKQRWGLKKINTVPLVDTVNRYWPFNLYQSQEPGLSGTMVFYAGPLYSIDPHTETAFTERDAVYQSTNPMYMSFISWKNAMITLTHGKKYNSSFVPSAISADSNCPSGIQTAIIFNRRMIYGGGISGIYGSKVDGVTDADGWSADNDWFYTDLTGVMPGLNSNVMRGFLPIGQNQLYIILPKSSGIFEIPVDPVSIKCIQVIERGAVSNFSFCKVGNDCIIADEHGVYALNIASTYQGLTQFDLSVNIKPFYKNLVNYHLTNSPLQNVMPKDYFPIKMIYFAKLNQILISIPQSFDVNGIDWTFGGFYEVQAKEANSMVLVYSLDLKEFTGRWEFPNIITGWDIDKYGDLYMTCGDGYLYKFDEDTYLDGTTPITFSFKPSYIGNESLDNYKSLKSLSIIAEANQATDLTLNYNVQPIAEKLDAAASSISEVVNLASGAGNSYDYDLIGRGKIIDTEFTHAVSGSRVTLGQITINANIEGTE